MPAAKNKIEREKVSVSIVFFDIVGFTEELVDRQSELVISLQYEVKKDLKEYFDEFDLGEDIIIRPTGDGMAIALVRGLASSKDALFMLILMLMKWKSREKVGLRVGVHFGIVEVIQDLSLQNNLIGSAINECQRIMDAANDNQVLISKDAVKNFYGNFEGEKFIEFNGGELRFTGPYTVIVKHDKVIDVHVLNIKEKSAPMMDLKWDYSPPLSKDHVKLSLTPLPKSLDEPFKERWKGAERIALVQLAGERLFEKLTEKQLVFNDKLEQFWVLVPSIEAYESLQLDGLLSINDFNEQIDAWKQWMTKFKEAYPDAEVSLYEYDTAPHFGGSFFDWHIKGGKIHISPYVWGTKPNQCPGIDMKWLGDKVPETFNAYVKGMKCLKKKSTKIV